MLRIERILVPIDFSPVSRVSTLYAIDVARIFNAELILLHVVSTSSFSGRLLFPQGMSSKETRILTEEESQQCKTVLDEFLAQLPLKGIRYSVHVEKGIPFLRILNAIRQTDPSVLVMGTHGATGFEHMIIGGTAERVIRKAGCPVLTLKPEGFETFFRKILDGARLFESKAKEEKRAPNAYTFPPRKVLYPTDFSEISEQALDYAVFIAQKANAQLIVLHATSSQEEPSGRADQGSESTSAIVQEVSAKMDDVLEEIKALFSQLKVVPKVVPLRPASAILSTAIKESVDIIVMGTHGWSSLGLLLSTSTTDRVIRDAPCPVLTIRPNWKFEEVETRFRKVFKKLSPFELQKISSENQAVFGPDVFGDPESIKKTDLFMRYYSKEGMATAFEEYGIFDTLRKKGFDDFLITFDLEDPFKHVMRVYFGGQEDPSHLLIDLVLRRGTLQSQSGQTESNGPYVQFNCPVMVIE